MKRRAYLAAITGSVLIAGCYEERPTAGSTDPSPQPSSSPTPELPTSNPQVDPETPTTRARRTQHLTTVNPSSALADNVYAEHAVHRRINDARYENGVNTLNLREDLQEVARSHSIDMAHKGYFAHQAPSGREFRPNNCSSWGENIFRFRGAGARDPKVIADVAVESWLGSEGHRANLLNPEFLREGVGVQWDSDGWVYVTQTLC